MVVTAAGRIFDNDSILSLERFQFSNIAICCGSDLYEKNTKMFFLCLNTMKLNFKRKVSNFTHFVLLFFVSQFMQCHEYLILFFKRSISIKTERV